MTQPTQAQIEAELTDIPRLKLQFERNHWRIVHRVDGRDMSAVDYDLVCAALAAAAQVGEQERLEADQKWVNANINAAIERCAQVADRTHISQYPSQIAAAIRKLKDAP